MMRTASNSSGLAARTLTYGLEPGADITTRKPAISFSGIECTAETPAGKIEIRSPSGGANQRLQHSRRRRRGRGAGPFARSHCLGNRATFFGARPIRANRCGPAISGGRGLCAHRRCVAQFACPPRRNSIPTGRIITLFGCGGDRDRTKRPLMGEAAGRVERRRRADFGQSAQRRSAADHQRRHRRRATHRAQNAWWNRTASAPSRSPSIRRAPATSCCWPARAMRLRRFCATARLNLTIAKWRGEFSASAWLWGLRANFEACGRSIVTCGRRACEAVRHGTCFLVQGR